MDIWPSQGKVHLIREMDILSGTCASGEGYVHLQKKYLSGQENVHMVMIMYIWLGNYTSGHGNVHLVGEMYMWQRKCTFGQKNIQL